MSRCAAHLRSLPRMREMQAEALAISERGVSLRARDTLITCGAVLSSMVAAAEGYGSQGGSLVLAEGGEPVHAKLSGYDYLPPAGKIDPVRIITEMRDDAFVSYAMPVESLPSPDAWFEDVWRWYRERWVR